MWNRGSRRERTTRRVVGAAALGLLLGLPWLLPGPANPRRLAATVFETAASLLRPGGGRLPLDVGALRVPGLHGAPVYELAPDGRGVIVGQVLRTGDGLVVALPPALAERYSHGAVLRFALPVDGLWSMVDLLFSPDGPEGELRRLRQRFDPLLRDRILPDIESGLREALRRFLAAVPRQDAELLSQAGADVLAAIRPELRPVATRVSARAWEVLRTTGAPGCAWRKVWALAKTTLVERLRELLAPIVAPLGEVVGDIEEVAAEEGWLSVRTLLAGGQALLRSIGKLPEILKAAWAQLSSLDLSAELDRFADAFVDEIPEAGFGECLSDDVGRRLEEALKEELGDYWAANGERILEAVGRALSRYEQPFVERLKRDLLPRVQEVGLRVWRGNREAIDGVAARYAGDLARRRFLTAEGGPRLPLAYVIRSAAGITRRPLLVIEEAPGRPGPPGLVPLVPFRPDGPTRPARGGRPERGTP